jgi:hypothetical protein
MQVLVNESYFLPFHGGVLNPFLMACLFGRQMVEKCTAA